MRAGGALLLALLASAPVAVPAQDLPGNGTAPADPAGRVEVIAPFGDRLLIAGAAGPMLCDVEIGVDRAVLTGCLPVTMPDGTGTAGAPGAPVIVPAPKWLDAAEADLVVADLSEGRAERAFLDMLAARDCRFDITDGPGAERGMIDAVAEALRVAPEDRERLRADLFVAVDGALLRLERDGRIAVDADGTTLRAVDCG